MLTKTLKVVVDPTTWPRGQHPPSALRSSSAENIDLKKAFLMLGTLTMPSLLSPASPALTWAWLRYTIAIANVADLRVTTPFADLDPHQKAVLSDDFGVAIATQWLHDRLGGFVDIVDGRRFMLQFASKIRRRQGGKAKIGPRKSPDFAVLDRSGKWHLLECKGTQSGNGARNAFLRTAVHQKKSFTLNGNVRGERLAAGLSISKEKSRGYSELRVIDPIDSLPPDLSLDDKDNDSMKLAAERISIARALGVVGLSEAAMDIWLPEDVSDAKDLLRLSELARLEESRQQRREKSRLQTRNRELFSFRRNGQDFEGKDFVFVAPQVEGSNIRTVRVTTGIFRDLLRRIEDAPLNSELKESVVPFARDAEVRLDSDNLRAEIRYGDIFYADLTINTL